MLKIKPQYFGVVEQILLSASNMVASLVVVKSAGVEWFGTYSFIFVLSTLVSAFLSTVLHRQMILVIASSNTQERRNVFLATLAIQIIAVLLLGGVLAGVLILFSDSYLISKFGREIIAATVFVGVYSFYDLCKQYLYVLGGQAYSLRCTALYVGALMIGIVWLMLSVQPAGIVAAMYGVISTALLISLVSNRRCLAECYAGEWIAWSHVLGVLKNYFEQGRFRLVGMLVTWAQNQSMTPVLMWLGGPLIVGYFSMARLIVMPMAVINQGLTNSTTAELRRIYEATGDVGIHQGIARYRNLSFLLAGAYLLFISVAHMTGLFERFVPEYSAVKWYLMIWIATLLVTMYRHWQTQFFIVSLQFRFLMHVSIAALVVSMSGMISAGYFLENLYLALVFVIVGELLSIFLFKRMLFKGSQ